MTPSSSTAERDDATPVDSAALPQPESPSLVVGLTTIAVAATAMVATLPGRTQGLGLITEPLLADLKLDRLDYGQINLWATLIGALFCFPAGRLLDRFGPRHVLAAVSASLGLVVLAMSMTTSVAAMFWLILLTRGLGRSALSVVSIALVGKAFDRRAAWPMPTYSVLLSIGFMFAFPLVQSLVKAHGWREPWGGVGLALVGFALLSWLALSRAPRMTAVANDAAGNDLPGLTLREALVTPVFWIFAGATSLFGLAASGLGLFNEDVLAERSLAEFYGKTLMISAPFGLLGQVCCGLLAKWHSYQRLTTAALAIYAVGLIGLTRVADPGGLYSCVSLLGFSGGMITVLFFAVWAQVFGRRQLGRIQGVAQMLTVFGSAVGPLVFAASRQYTGSYFTILYSLAGVVLALAVAAWFASLPRTASETPHVD